MSPRDKLQIYIKHFNCSNCFLIRNFYKYVTSTTTKTLQRILTLSLNYIVFMFLLCYENGEKNGCWDKSM